MLKLQWLKIFLLVNFASVFTPAFGASSEKTVVPVFLFSGQSNMVGLGAQVSGLSSEDKQGFENVKIYLESEGQGLGEWRDLEPGYGGNSTFGPELFFGKVLAKEMPEVKIAFIKDARSGTWLGKSNEWLPPSSGGPGPFYSTMMDHIETALSKFNDAYDTSVYTPKWAGFIWHQGEFDAMGESFGSSSPALANKYEENLTNLISDIRTMAEAENLPAIVPMIAEISMWPYADIVRQAEVAVGETLDNCDTMDLATYNLSDGVHYDAPSMKVMGSECALRWLAMEYTKDWWNPVPVVHQNRPSVTSSISFDKTVFDLSGRMAGTQSGSQSSGRFQGRKAVQMFIGTGRVNSAADKRQSLKVMNLHE